MSDLRETVLNGADIAREFRDIVTIERLLNRVNSEILTCSPGVTSDQNLVDIAAYLGILYDRLTVGVSIDKSVKFLEDYRRTL